MNSSEVRKIRLCCIESAQHIADDEGNVRNQNKRTDVETCDMDTVTAEGKTGQSLRRKFQSAGKWCAL